MLGRHDHAIEALTDEVKSLRAKLDRLSHIVYAAGSVLAVLYALAKFFLK